MNMVTARLDLPMYNYMLPGIQTFLNLLLEMLNFEWMMKNMLFFVCLFVFLYVVLYF